MGENTWQQRPMAAAPADFRQATDEGTPVWGGAFQDPGAASIDDLLFGFNALDNTPFFT